MLETRALQFTPVELAFLARATESVAGSRTAARLHLGDGAGDAVIASGYGSLRIRGWAHTTSDGLELDPALTGIAATFAAASQWIQLTFVGTGDVASMLLIRGDQLSVLLRALDAGVIDVAALEGDMTPERTAAKLIAGFVGSPDPEILTVEVESGGISRVVSARQLRGAWSIQSSAGSADTDEISEGGLTAADVVARLVVWMAATDPVGIRP
jgi:hypothetical protein